jgi:hypothetical protein
VYPPVHLVITLQVKSRTYLVLHQAQLSFVVNSASVDRFSSFFEHFKRFLSSSTPRIKSGQRSLVVQEGWVPILSCTLREGRPQQLGSERQTRLVGGSLRVGNVVLIQEWQVLGCSVYGAKEAQRVGASLGLTSLTTKVRLVFLTSLLVVKWNVLNTHTPTCVVSTRYIHSSHPCLLGNWRLQAPVYWSVRGYNKGP